MTREILFRGRRVFVPNEWVYGSLLTDFESEYHENRRITAMAYFDGFQKIAEVQPETVGQFCGLLDKNGTKIFESDIVIHPGKSVGGDSPRPAQVVFKEGGWMGYFPIGSVGTKWVERIDRDDFFEVIGNIHEHSELLTEAK